MQGRLSPMVDERIQAFPWNTWKEEFEIGGRNGFGLMEWTLDHARLAENPLLTSGGQSEIRELCRRHGILIPSLTGDCFMQAPWWKADPEQRVMLQREFDVVANACADVGITTIVVPLVDNGRLVSCAEEDALVNHLERRSAFLAGRGLRVVFESDYPPAELARFIDRLDPALFGINYDMGNSAAAGLIAAEELRAYGHRVTNVHVKDRVLGGATVPLETGNTDFTGVFAALGRLGYTGNYILQTARATDSDHVTPLRRYRDMTAEWMRAHAA